MFRNTLIVMAGLGFLALAGCEIYFGPPSDCNDWDDCRATPWEPPSEVPPGGSGWACDVDSDCAPGCYCDNGSPGEGFGYCQEAGFCTIDAECATGFYCDVRRNSCVPRREDGRECNGDWDCPDGAWCLTDIGVCVGEPPPPDQRCEEDRECAMGCVCNEGVCIETGFCRSDEDCGGDMVCDLDRADPAGTGTCDFPVSEPPPPPTCQELVNVDECLATPGCDPIFTGENCTCADGSDACDCSAAPDTCMCETYEFAGCFPAAAPPIPMP